MNGDCTVPGLRSLPAGLLGMLALTAALEWGVFRNSPNFASDHAASWRYADHYAVRKARGREILCMGDSLVKFGLLPSVLSEQTGKSAYNLAIFSGPTPATYFLLRRALAQGARPGALVVDCAAGILMEGPASQQRAYPWSHLVTTREALELAWTARDPGLGARIVLEQAFHSIKDRYEIRDGIATALRGGLNHRPMEIAISHRNWNRNDGAQAQAKRDFVDYPPPEGRPPAPSWQCAPANEAYFQRLLALAARHQIAVYWLLPPYSPGAQAHNEHRGEDALYDGFVRRTSERFPNVVVIDARHAGFARTEFFDHAHLDCDGATAMSAAVAEVLNGAPAAERWVNLPTPPRTRRRRVEDTAQSILAVKENARRSRR